MLGPYVTETDACTTWIKAHPNGTCGIDPTPSTTLAAPYLAVAAAHTFESRDGSQGALRPMVRTAAGWFLADDAAEIGEDGAAGTDYVTKGRVTDIITTRWSSGPSMELVFAITLDVTASSTNGGTAPTKAAPYSSQGVLVACGVGGSGSPSCLDPIEANLTAASSTGAFVAAKFPKVNAHVPGVIDIADVDGSVLVLGGHYDRHHTDRLHGLVEAHFP